MNNPQGDGLLSHAIQIYVDVMNDAEAEVVLYIARRIHEGRSVYGPLNPNDGRNWPEEAKQEMADWLVYRAIQEVAEKPAQQEIQGWSDTSWMIKGGYIEEPE